MSSAILKAIGYVCVIVLLLIYILVLQKENANLKAENIANRIALDSANHAYENAVKKQQELDKEAAKYREQEYKTIQQIKESIPAPTCDLAIEQYKPYLINS